MPLTANDGELPACRRRSAAPRHKGRSAGVPSALLREHQRYAANFGVAAPKFLSQKGRRCACPALAAVGVVVWGGWWCGGAGQPYALPICWPPGCGGCGQPPPLNTTPHRRPARVKTSGRWPPLPAAVRCGWLALVRACALPCGGPPSPPSAASPPRRGPRSTRAVPARLKSNLAPGVREPAAAAAVGCSAAAAAGNGKRLAVYHTSPGKTIGCKEKGQMRYVLADRLGG